MKKKVKDCLGKILVGIPFATLLILAVAGSEFKSLTPFVVTVNADEYGSQKDDDKDDHHEEEVEISEEKAKEIAYQATTEAKVSKDTRVASVSLGNDNYSGGSSVGGGVQNIVSNQSLAQKSYTTGARADLGELPYTKAVTDVGPLTKAAFTNEATSRGYIPGGIFDLEVGVFTTAGGYKASNITYAESSFDVVINPLPGYRPSLLYRSISGNDALGIAASPILLVDDWNNATKPSLTPIPGTTNKYSLKTWDPKGIYMVVYIPE